MARADAAKAVRLRLEERARSRAANALPSHALLVLTRAAWQEHPGAAGALDA